MYIVMYFYMQRVAVGPSFLETHGFELVVVSYSLGFSVRRHHVDCFSVGSVGPKLSASSCIVHDLTYITLHVLRLRHADMQFCF